LRAFLATLTFHANKDLLYKQSLRCEQLHMRSCSTTLQIALPAAQVATVELYCVLPIIRM